MTDDSPTPGTKEDISEEFQAGDGMGSCRAPRFTTDIPLKHLKMTPYGSMENLDSQMQDFRYPPENEQMSPRKGPFQKEISSSNH